MLKPLFLATLLLSLPAAGVVPSAQAGATLDRIVAEKFIRFGLRTDAPPFAYVQDGKPAGFSVELCGLMAGAIMATSKIEKMDGRFIPVDTDDRFAALQSGEIDVLCGATTATLTRRETVSFSLPVFSTGIGAAVATGAPDLLKEVLITGGPASQSAAAIETALSGKTVGVRANTTASDWLETGPLSRVSGLTVQGFDDHADGLAAVADGRLAAYFADRTLLAGTIMASEMRDDLLIARTNYTQEPYALALPRGDEDLRLLVDRALSHIYRSGDILKLYEKHFGTPTPEAVLFYSLVALPE